MARVTYQKGCIDEILVYKHDGNKRIIDSTPGYQFDKNGECAIEMHFYDGLAIATDDSGIVLTYPTLKNIKHSWEKKHEIEEYTGRDDITQFEVALKYGELKKYKMVADFNLWVMQDDNNNIDITAIHDNGRNFLFDVLEDDYEEMFYKDIVEGDELLGEPSDEQIEEWRTKYGILWTEHIKDDIIKV